MKTSQIFITVASAAALVSAIGFAYAQTTDPAPRSMVPDATAPTDTSPNSNRLTPMNGSTMPATGNNATTQGSGNVTNNGSLSKDGVSNTGAASSNTDSSNGTPAEPPAKVDRG